MRPARVGVLLGALAGVALWSCSVNRASEDLRCTSNDDCALDRVCVQNYCIAGTNPRFDAGRPDTATCPAICNGGCDLAAGTCTIVGAGNGNITCPAGWSCHIRCEQSGACGSITCTVADACTIECTADGACNGITCNTKDCNVTCTGTQACGNITCTSGDCTATCTGAGACGSLNCTTGDCTETCSGGAAACGTLNCGTGACSATCIGAESACGTVNCANSCKCDVSCNGVTNTCPAQMNCPDAPGNLFCTANGSDGQRCSSGFAQQCNNC